jgi:hypothetical protein
MRFTIVLIAGLASGSASAQVWDPAYRGSGHRAGGPAYLLNTGGYAGPGWAYSYRYGPRRFLAYRGSGHRAGGPAYLLNTGGYAGPGWVYTYRYGPRRFWNPAYHGSGHRAGGPAYLLNSSYGRPGWRY